MSRRDGSGHFAPQHDRELVLGEGAGAGGPGASANIDPVAFAQCSLCGHVLLEGDGPDGANHWNVIADSWLRPDAPHDFNVGFLFACTSARSCKDHARQTRYDVPPVLQHLTRGRRDEYFDTTDSGFAAVKMPNWMSNVAHCCALTPAVSRRLSRQPPHL